MSPPPSQPIYIGAQPNPIFATLHSPAKSHKDVAVLLCPPFGWEDMCSYRGRGEWAGQLAASGYPTLRIDYPGTGDSGGSPHDLELLETWTNAVAEAAHWLRASTGCRRIVAFGISLGGLLAFNATSSGAPVDDLVLWGVSARGHTFLRELRAFSKMETHQLEDPTAEASQTPEATDGSLLVAGYLLSAETMRDLDALDLSQLNLPGPHARRVLLLKRDGRKVDTRLRASIERAGAHVSVAPGDGYSRMMMVEPQFAHPPAAVLAHVIDWLAASEHMEPPVPISEARPPTSTEAQMLAADGTLVRETVRTFAHPRGSMFGVLTEPIDTPSTVTALLLGGTGHRIGPNRMWVEAARRWATWGISTVRLDLAGAGDAEGAMPPDVPSLYLPEVTEQVGTALRELAEIGLPKRTVTVGLCVGAYWAMHAALSTEQEVVPVTLNLPVLIWDEHDHINRMTRHYLQQLRYMSNWKRLLRRETSLGGVCRILLRRVATIFRSASAPASESEPVSASSDELDRVLDDLRDRDLPVRMLFTGREWLYQDFEREGRLQRLDRWPNLTLEVLSGHTDLHTLRPMWLQRRVHELLDDTLRHELAGDEHMNSR